MLVSTIKNHPFSDHFGWMSLYRPNFKNHCRIVEAAGAAIADIQFPSVWNIFERARNPAELPRKHSKEIKIWVTLYLYP